MLPSPIQWVRIIIYNRLICKNLFILFLKCMWGPCGPQKYFDMIKHKQSWRQWNTGSWVPVIAAGWSVLFVLTPHNPFRVNACSTCIVKNRTLYRVDISMSDCSNSWQLFSERWNITFLFIQCDISTFHKQLPTIWTIGHRYIYSIQHSVFRVHVHFAKERK